MVFRCPICHGRVSSTVKRSEVPRFQLGRERCANEFYTHLITPTGTGVVIREDEKEDIELNLAS